MAKRKKAIQHLINERRTIQSSWDPKIWLSKQDSRYFRICAVTLLSFSLMAATFLAAVHIGRQTTASKNTLSGK